jgi:hypothetical protein
MDFDLFSAAFHADPFPTYRAMREQAPLYAMPSRRRHRAVRDPLRRRRAADLGRAAHDET